MNYKTTDVQTASGLVIVFEFPEYPGERWAIPASGFASGQAMLEAARTLAAATRGAQK
jgi:hypothetical protein